MTLRRTVISGALAAGALIPLSQPAAAAPSVQGLTRREEKKAIDSTAAGLQELFETGGLRLDTGEFVEITLDEILARMEEQISEAPPTDMASVMWDWNRFGNCVAKELGVATAKEIIKAFNEPRVRRALKSRQWRVASSIFFETVKKVSPKLARFLIKKAANSLLPGGVVGIIVVAVAKCGVKEVI